MNIQDRHLVDRYLQGELSGIELEDFKNRLSSDKEFNREVDLLKIIYSGIHLAREEQLKKRILSSIKYRKQRIPFALKLIITFLIVTGSFISLWFYAGKEFKYETQQKSWFSFLNKNSKTEKNKNRTAENDLTKSNTGVSQINKMDSDTTHEEHTLTAESGTNQLNELVDTTEINNTEDIVVKQDQLLISASLPVIDRSINEKENANSLTANASQKMSAEADLPEPENKAKDYDVEFWVSPVNYKGYKMSKNKIVLFGIEEPDAVKLYRVNDAIYMTYLKAFYELENHSDFKSYQKLKESEVPKVLNEKSN